MRKVRESVPREDVMNTDDIWNEPVEKRMELFIERWEELDEYVGCRTPAERHEMYVIAISVMTELIKCWKQHNKLGQP